MCRFPTGPVQEGLQQCSSAPAVWKIPLQSTEAVQGNSPSRSIFHQTHHTRHRKKAFTICVYVTLLNPA